MRLSAIRVDAKAIENGVELPKAGDPDFVGFPGVRLTVRGLTSTAFNAKRREIMGGLPDDAAEDVRDQAFGKVIAQSLLLDWKGFEADDDTPLAYSPAIGEAMLSDPTYRNLRGLVLMAAGLADEVKPSAEAQLEKN